MATNEMNASFELGSFRKMIRLPHSSSWRVAKEDTAISGEEVLTLIKHKGLLLNRTTTLAKRAVTLTTQGVMLIYDSDELGYALNLHDSVKIKTLTATPTGVVYVKIKMGYGTVTLLLTDKTEGSSWATAVLGVVSGHTGLVARNSVGCQVDVNKLTPVSTTAAEDLSSSEATTFAEESTLATRSQIPFEPIPETEDKRLHCSVQSPLPSESSEATTTTIEPQSFGTIRRMFESRAGCCKPEVKTSPPKDEAKKTKKSRTPRRVSHKSLSAPAILAN